ncbi:MAG TPA: hypothetical protein VI138_05475, partial [Candidatus Dormibacteraeota bacterium]
LVTKSAHGGPAAVRHSGVEASRAPFVFFLDSEETLYPKALARLRGALAESAATFAYGIVQRVGVEPGLSNYLPWDVDRLCTGNYLSGAALVRRQALEQLGGLQEAPVTMSGSEEYDLWLRFAAEGYHGTLLPEVVVRRQNGPRNRLSRTKTVGRGEPDRRLRDRYPALPWPAP